MPRVTPVTDSGASAEQGAELHQALVAAQEAVSEEARLTGRHDELLRDLATARTLVEANRQALAVETRDVERLESFSPTRIWAGLRGSRLTDLDRERAEQQAAEYAVAAAQARADTLQAEADHVAARLAELGDVQERLARARTAKQDWLVATHHPAADELTELAAALGARSAEQREVFEAATAADSAQAALARAAELLSSARSWSTFDTFFDGGLVTDMMKYDRLDQAQTLLRAADDALRRLSRELADLGRTGVGTVEITEMTRFFDVWFDNIFSDWSVRNRITEAASRVAATQSSVEGVRRELATRATDLAAEIARAADRRDALLAAGD